MWPRFFYRYAFDRFQRPMDRSTSMTCNKISARSVALSMSFRKSQKEAEGTLLIRVVDSSHSSNLVFSWNQGISETSISHAPSPSHPHPQFQRLIERYKKPEDFKIFLTMVLELYRTSEDFMILQKTPVDFKTIVSVISSLLRVIIFLVLV